MTDLAPSTSSKSSYPAATSSPSSGYLKLQGTDPQQVYVQIFTVGGQPAAGFAISDGGTYFTDGIEWSNQSGSSYAKFVTFVFSSSVASISCDGLSYSDEYGSSPVKQDLCIIPAPGTDPVTYHFNVYPSSTGTGASPLPIDPKIVVTPINGTGDGT